MAENSGIQWTDHTFNPWRGCTKVSAGCAHCYAETLSGRNPGTLGVWGPNGTRVIAAESQWKLPLKWNREAEAEARFRTIKGIPVERPRVFCASLADVFEDWQGPMVDAQGSRLWVSRCVGANDVPDFIPERPQCDFSQCRPLTMSDVRRRLFALIDATPSLDWLVLTKRPENIERMLPAWTSTTHDVLGRKGLTLTTNSHYPPRENLWIGTSVENQAAADERIPHLLRAPAAVRFLSCEPLLSEIQIDKGRRSWLGSFEGTVVATGEKRKMPGIDWVIVGGESGAGARPFNVDWARGIVRQCREANVAVFVKQFGANVVDHCDEFTPQATGWPEANGPANWENGDIHLRDKKGGNMAEWPEALRVREFPRPRP